MVTEKIPLDPAFEEALNDRLVLVFTGKQRLARSAGRFSARMSTKCLFSVAGKTTTCLHPWKPKARGDVYNQLHFVGMLSENSERSHRRGPARVRGRLPAMRWGLPVCSIPLFIE